MIIVLDHDCMSYLFPFFHFKTLIILSSGDLTAHCTGFSKVAFCEMVDQMDGTFVLIIKPQESGRHTLTIKYGGENVPGKYYHHHLDCFLPF